MSLTPRLLLIVGLLLAVLLARQVPRRWGARLAAAMAGGRWLPLLVGAGVALLTAWIWGGLRAPAVIQDESAYRLQAELLASGHWSHPSPPILAPFTQAAVLVAPVVAPKMAPGHAILLMPGVVVGLPGLMPVAMVGFAALMIVVLVRRFYGAGVALLTAVLWLVAAGQSRWRTSYMSENSTALLWLAGWWCLVRWRETRQRGWLLALAVACGWGAIIRPLTMLLFALPIGVIVVRDVIHSRLWGQLAAAIGMGLLPLTLLPLQNAAITGNWRSSPLALYTRQYAPMDRIGFGLDSTPPELPLPADLRAVYAGFAALHAQHQPAALPGILAARLRAALNSTFGGWRTFLAVPAILGLLWLGAAGWFAVGTGLLLYLGYLIYAHQPYWTVYYLEATPILALPIAIGLNYLLTLATSKVTTPVVASLAAAAALFAVALPDLLSARSFRAHEQQRYLDFTHQLASRGSSRMLVFVRYGPGHDPNSSLVRNVADPARAPFLTAYDLGAAANARLAAAYPERAPYFWDEATHRLTRGVGP